MIYDLKSSLDVERLETRLAHLKKSGRVVELTERKKTRSLSQNRYLHLLLGYFACETGNTLEYVKVNYFKTLCNGTVFVSIKRDEYMGDVVFLKSSSELTTAEMTECIERFRNWASSEAGIYLPEPNEYEHLLEIEKEIERQKHYL